MTFLNLRNGNLLYVLKKDQLPILEIGKVINVSLPVPRYGNTYNLDMVVDITVDINGNITNFLKLPATSEIADFGNNIVISTNKDAMNSEINSMKLKSIDVINSILLHKDIIRNCDKIVEQLNPEIVEKQRLEQALRDEINSLKEMVKEFLKSKEYGTNN